MRLQRDSEFSDWRRRAHSGARDIAFAVVLTVISAALLGVAWLGQDRASQARLGTSAEVAPR